MCAWSNCIKVLGFIKFLQYSNELSSRTHRLTWFSIWFRNCFLPILVSTALQLVFILSYISRQYEKLFLCGRWWQSSLWIGFVLSATSMYWKLQVSFTFLTLYVSRNKKNTFFLAHWPQEKNAENERDRVISGICQINWCRLQYCFI